MRPTSEKQPDDYVRKWPTATVTLDRVTTAAIEGAADQMRLQTVVDRRAVTRGVSGVTSSGLTP
jgi:hypothetical protein